MTDRRFSSPDYEDFDNLEQITEDHIRILPYHQQKGAIRTQQGTMKRRFQFIML